MVGLPLWRMAICLVALVVPMLLPVQIQALQRVELNEDDLLVLESGIENYDLSQTLFVYQQPESTLIPLQALIDLLDFPLSIDVAAQTVDGWFINETQTFSLDIEQQTLFIEGQQVDWPKRPYYAADDFDLYFDYRLLEQWFGLQLTLNVSQLTLSISSDVELPIVIQARRHLKREMVKEKAEDGLPTHYLANRYQWFGNPSFDLEISDDVQRTQGDFAQFPGGVLQGRMDLLQHSMRASYVNANRLDDLRLTFSRAASGPDQEMFLGLTEYELGDLFIRSDSLMYSSIKGRGVSFTRGAGARLDKVDEINIEGDAPPGWEVELYRNGSLIAFINAPPNGRYEFFNVLTFVGQNVFDIRVYGPQGQFRSRREEINIGPGMIETNAWGYNLSAVEKNANLVRLSGASSEDISAFFQADVSYGVNEYLTLQTGVSRFTPLAEVDPHTYTSVEAFTSVSGVFAHLRYVDDMDSGTAVAAVVKGSWNEVNLNMDVLKFNAFVSDNNAGAAKNSDIKIGVNGLARMIRDIPVTYEFELKDTGFRIDNRHQRSLSNRLSFNLSLANISHEIRYTFASQGEQDDSLVANLSANRRFYQWRLKAELDYALMPTERINSLGLGATWKPSLDFVYQTQLDYGFSGVDELSVNNTFTWDFRYLSLSASAGFTTNGDQTAGLSLNTSFGYDRGRSQFLISRDNLSTNGSATARVYLDRNHDGEFNADDQPLKGVTFKGRAAWRQQETDALGLLTLNGIPAREFQRIELDEGSLGDPFLQPVKRLRYLYTHEGAANYIDFPILETVEIEGSIVRVKQSSLEQGTEQIMNGVPVQLVSDQGEVVVQSVSEFDGVYILEKVVPGQYHLEIPSAFLRKHKLQREDVQTLTVKGNEGVLYLDPVRLSSP